ncbi:hypothetical protein ACEZCY_35825 [Streptacidiphilus sp. N1-12]|uniref:Bacteriocin biosynthesis cyclodehydratase domain-containing protein n=1 Tax=Streptacidiphilus alkalitolerans TaxID=3342712 RepID=A0ABV6WR80_9ACTN
MTGGRPGTRPVPDSIPAHLHQAYRDAHGRELPPHCPYRPGDAVQLHGYAGEAAGPRRTGFRGWVAATVGATILTGITTDGTEWWEEWGLLRRDGLPVDLWGGCTCCHQTRLALLRAHYAAQRPNEQQLHLFDAQ